MDNTNTENFDEDMTHIAKKFKAKPIKIVKHELGDFWNANDGTETYSKNIEELLKYLGVAYELEVIR